MTISGKITLCLSLQILRGGLTPRHNIVKITILMVFEKITDLHIFISQKCYFLVRIFVKKVGVFPSILLSLF